MVRDFSPVGPNMRGSGYARDNRADHSFGAYDRAPWEVICKDGCDVLSRELVRVEDLYQSFNIIERCLLEMPAGPILVVGFSYKPYTYALGATEAPRGKNVHWVMTGANQKLYRWRAQTATYNNWPSPRYMFRGNTISDVPLIVDSLDPCYSCTERVTVIHVRKKKAKSVSYKELENYCRERKYSPLKV